MFAFRVALRFLFSNKAQTVFIVLGIAVGISVQVFIGSLIQGLQNDLVDSTIGRSSHVTVQAAERGATFDDQNTVLSTIREADGQIIAVARVVEGSGSLNTGSKNDPVVVRGFDFTEADDIYRFTETLIDGRLPDANGEVMLGKDLVEAAGIALGSTLSIQVPEVGESDVTVVGVFDFGVTSINESWLVTTLDTARTTLSVNGLTRIETQIDDVFLADDVAANLAAALGSDYRISEWKRANQELLSGLEGQSISSLMIQVFVLVSVVLGIASVLAITVLQKSKQLGILKAMGARDRQASQIFLFEGMLLGVFGAILGVSLGLGLGWMFGQFAVTESGDPVVSIAINPGFIAISASIAIVASLIASLIPARRSATLNVIEVIRNG